jgi:hypothetical protein
VTEEVVGERRKILDKKTEMNQGSPIQNSPVYLRPSFLGNLTERSKDVFNGGF